MTPKSTKKQHSAKNTLQNRPAANFKRADGGGKGRGGIKRNSAKNTDNHMGGHSGNDSGHKAPPRPPQNGYFIWGRHAVLAALANPDRRIAQIYCAADNHDMLKDALNQLENSRRNELPQPQTIDRARLDKVGNAGEKAVHQGIAAAVWSLDPPHLDDFLATLGDGNTRLLLLDQLSDPRNVGAIMRSARAFNVAGIITTHRNAAEENGVLARTASGALDHVPLVRVVNLARAIERLKDAGIFVAGLAGDAAADVAVLADHPRLAIMLGAEGSGLRRLSRDHCDLLVGIKIYQTADSLNVSNAAAIALYAAKN